MSTALRRLPAMDVSEFLRWDSGDDVRYELVDGAPTAMAPAGSIHGYLQNELGSLLRNHLRERRNGCRVIANPGVVPHLLSHRNFRIPDLGVTCAQLERGQRDIREPLLLVEILSPSNANHTWSNVWAYTSISSLKEVLVLESETVAAEVMRRGAEGEWPDRPERIGSGDRLCLRSIGFEIALSELYAETGLA